MRCSNRRRSSDRDLASELTELREKLPKIVRPSPDPSDRPEADGPKDGKADRPESEGAGTTVWAELEIVNGRRATAR